MSDVGPSRKNFTEYAPASSEVFEDGVLKVKLASIHIKKKIRRIRSSTSSPKDFVFCQDTFKMTKFPHFLAGSIRLSNQKSEDSICFLLKWCHQLSFPGILLLLFKVFLAYLSF